MKHSRLIYISSSHDSVFESQVLDYLKALKKKNIFTDIFLILGVKNGIDVKFQPSIENSGLNVLSFKLLPNYSIYRKMQRTELLKPLKNLFVSDTIVHVRNESLSQVLKPIVVMQKEKNIRILTDVRGAVYEETKLYKKFNPLLFRMKLYQHKSNLKRLYKNTDMISCVSSELKRYVLDRTNIDSEKVFVNHCLAGTNFKFSQKIRSEYRNKLNIEEGETLFLFSTGGDGNWQNTTNTISSIANKGFKILNLSKNNINHENVINLFVSYEEVPKYLNAVDIAVIWRDDNVVNNVASPVKFSEYACMGLPLIANNGVCLIHNYIETYGFGKVIKQFDDINSDAIIELMKLKRAEISTRANNLFSSDAIVNQYVSLYGKIVG